MHIDWLVIEQHPFKIVVCTSTYHIVLEADKTRVFIEKVNEVALP
jgi:hypothetical protein